MYAPSQDLLAGQCPQCGKPLKQRRTGRVRKFCSARCRKAHSRFSASFVTPGRVVSDCHETPKFPQQDQQPARAKIEVEGRPRSPSRLNVDAAGGEAVAAANRLNARHWREAEPLAAEQAEIEANGYFTEPEWREVVSPDGVKCYATRFRPATGDSRTTDIPDDLSIPVFLKRTSTESTHG
jgi:hypothetical protein